jgi:hypothetical protein
MEISAPKEGNKPENSVKSISCGADNDDGSTYFTINALRLYYKD